jgi:hypothetical protein
MIVSCLRIALIVACALTLLPSINLAAPLATSFTYQGHLNHLDAPINDTADFQFRLWNAPSNGVAIGVMNGINDVEIVDGLFTVMLDFGAYAFDGEARWLEIAVRTPHDATDSEPFTILSPRQPLTAVPYALQTRGLYVNEIGRVGIGTKMPESSLDVVGGLQTLGAGSAVRVQNPNNGGASVTLDWASDVARIRIGGAGTGSQNGFDIQTAGETSRLRVLNNGNVGLGTTNPEARLDVRGTITSRVGAGNNDNIVVQKPGDIGPSNTSFRFSHRTNGTEMWLYAFGDSGFQNLQGWDYANSRVLFPANGNDLVVDIENSRVGMGTTAPLSKLHVTSSEVETVRAINTSVSNFRFGVYGETASDGEGAGVFGRATSTDGFLTKGVWGISDSDEGYGVWGQATSATGSPTGVFGSTSASEGYGVVGSASGSFGTGVRGSANGSSGSAVWGSAFHSSGNTIAVGGQALSPNGYAGYFIGRAYVSLRLGVGIEPHASYRIALPNTANNAGRAIANRWDTYSSREWKENIRPIDNPLEIVSRLTGVRFDWKDAHEGAADIGFIAEEVGEVLPEIVTYSADGTRAEAMDYARVTPLLVEAVKELDAQSRAKEARIAELEARLERLEAMLEVAVAE